MDYNENFQPDNSQQDPKPKKGKGAKVALIVIASVVAMTLISAAAIWFFVVPTLPLKSLNTADIAVRRKDDGVKRKKNKDKKDDDKKSGDDDVVEDVELTEENEPTEAPVATEEPTKAPTPTEMPDPTEGPEPTAAPLADHPDAAEWTVMIYISGTNLEREYAVASRYLNDLATNLNSDDINIVVETGGSLIWNNKLPDFANTTVGKIDIPTDKLGRFKVEHNNIIDLGAVELNSMGSADTLSDFIKWAKESYPAKRNMFIFWDHGYVEPYGCMEHDEIYFIDANGNAFNGSDNVQTNSELYENDCLTLDEIRSGFEAAQCHFDLLGFNTCLSASLEVAGAVEPYADYMVASQESIPANIGLPMQFVSYLSEHPTEGPRSIGTKMVEYYEQDIAIMDKLTSGQDGNELFTKGTMSLINLSYIPKIEAAFADIMEKLYYSTYDDVSFSQFQLAAYKCENYGSEGNISGNLIDLKSFLTESAKLLNDTDADESILKLLKNAIPASCMGSSRFESNGLSFYFPDMSYAKGVRKAYLDLLNVNGIDYDDEMVDEIVSNYITLAFDGYVDNIDYMDGYYWYAAYLGTRFMDYWTPSNDVNNLVAKNLDPSYADLVAVPSDPEDIEYNITFDDTGSIKLDITSGEASVLSVESNVVFTFLGDEGDLDFYMYLGSDKIERNSAGSYVMNFDRTALLFNGGAIPYFIIEDTPNYTTYGMPAMVDDVYSYVLFQYDKAADTYSFLYSIPSSALNDVASTDISPIVEGTVIDPITMSHIYNLDQQANPYLDKDFAYCNTYYEPYTCDGVTCPIERGEIRLRTDKDLTILVSFIIKDSYGNMWDTKAVEFYYDKDRNLVSVKEAEGYFPYGNIYEINEE